MGVYDYNLIEKLHAGVQYRFRGPKRFRQRLNRAYNPIPAPVSKLVLYGARKTAGGFHSWLFAVDDRTEEIRVRKPNGALEVSEPRVQLV